MPANDQLKVKAWVAFSADRHEVALHFSNRLINDLQQQIVKALELRASIWEKKANLTEELKDALQIIKYDRFNMNAHLRAAKVYSRQERLQEAIDILCEALCTFPGRRKADQIKKQIAKAKKRLNHRVDFITAAPYDIVCNIVSHLAPYEAFTCLDVCDRWREVLLSCPAPWEKVEPNLMCWYQGFDMVPTVSHHVQSLPLRHGPRFIAPAFKFLKECPFPRLQYLEIMDTTKNNPLLGDPLYEALHQVADTLTGLKLHARINLPLGKILTICSKLTSVDVSVENITDWTTGLPTASTLLTAVSITSNFPANRNDLAPFFQCAPHLQKVIFRPKGWNEDIPDILPLIEHCNQSLSYIFTGFAGIVNIFEWADPREPSSGLEQVSIDNVSSTMPLLSRLERATDSLRTLHIKPANYGRDSTLADWRPLSCFIMHKLTSLNIIAEPSSALYQHFPEMLHSYPALERLRLSGAGMWTTVEDEAILDSIFAATANLERLHDLQLQRLALDGQGFGLLIKKYAMQESPALKSLHIQDVKISNNILYDIARIRSLEELHIYHDQLEFESDTVDELTQLAAELPRLKTISLYNGIELTDNASRSIASSKSLEVLHLNTEYLSKKSYAELEHLFLHRNR